MDKRINYRIVLDTETCPLDKDQEKVSPYNMLAYDIGWAVVDKHGKVYRTRSFINADVYIGEKELMKSAYYANKIPQYEKDLRAGKRMLASIYTIKIALLEDIHDFNVKQIYAHNMYFDYTALNNTMRWVTKSACRYFFPRGVEICDTLRMSRDVVSKKPTYKKYCKENGYLTKTGAVRLTAEVLYRYITKDHAFMEAHTGLEDVMIEKDILAYCFRQHKKMNRLCWG